MKIKDHIYGAATLPPFKMSTFYGLKSSTFWDLGEKVHSLGVIRVKGPHFGIYVQKGPQFWNSAPHILTLSLRP